MANPAQRDFSYIEYSRPVHGEAIEKFIAEVDGIGRDIWGIDQKSVISSPIGVDDLENMSEAELLYATQQLRTVGPSRVITYDVDSLDISLLYRRVPREANMGGSFNSAASKMARAVFEDDVLAYNAKRRPRSVPGGGLQAQMTRIDLEHGVTTDEVEVEFTAIVPNPDPDLNRRGLELALVPNPVSDVTRILVKQSETCFHALAGLSRKAAYPTGRSMPLNLPFARLPKKYTEEEARTFFERLEERLPVRGIMGAVRKSPTVHS